jgi:hypothetical protein
MVITICIFMGGKGAADDPAAFGICVVMLAVVVPT